MKTPLWALLITIAFLSNTAFAYIKTYNFPNEAALKQWNEKIFSGRTTYEVKVEDGNGFLYGHTTANSSALYAEVQNWDLEKNPTLSWEWRVEKFPPRQPDLTKQSDDYAMRLYVVFPGTGVVSFLNSKAIAYAWDPKAPVDTVYESATTKNMKIIVAASGANTMEWKQEKRNVLKDYEMAFGKKPDRAPGAIGILVDSDDLKKLSAANIRFVNVGGPPL